MVGLAGLGVSVSTGGFGVLWAAGALAFVTLGIGVLGRGFGGAACVEGRGALISGAVEGGAVLATSETDTLAPLILISLDLVVPS